MVVGRARIYATRYDCTRVDYPLCRTLSKLLSLLVMYEFFIFVAVDIAAHWDSLTRTGNAQSSALKSKVSQGTNSGTLRDYLILAVVAGV